jgi:putative peptidoglycan lipid II flippase
MMVFVLGAGIYTDALVVALKFANTFRRIFAEGAFNASFLPRFSKVLNGEGKSQANMVLTEIFSFLLLVVILFSIAIIVFFPQILQIMVLGFDVLSKKFAITVNLGRICFPYLILISLSSLFSGVLNTLSKFALPAAVFSLMSIFSIFGLTLCYVIDASHLMTVYVIAVLVFFSGITQTTILLFAIKRQGFFVRIKLACWSPRVKDMVLNMVPGVIAAGVWQLNLLIDTSISSYLPTGSITCINLADRLNQFPLGTLGVAVSTALLPILSQCMVLKNHELASGELLRGLLLSMFFIIFTTTALVALGEPIVAVVYQRGLFGIDQVHITADAVMGFSIGLPAYVLTKLFSTIYFAAEDTITPVIFAIISVLINAILLFVLVPFLKYFGVALCTSLSAIFNAIMLICFSGKKLKIELSRKFVQKIFAQIGAAVITYIVMDAMCRRFWTPELGAFSQKYIVVGTMFSIGVLVFFFSTVLIMKLMKHDHWRLWEKSAW